MEYHYVICKKCGVTLRVPKNIGLLAVSCPKCRYQFKFHSGPKQTSASHAYYGNTGFRPNPNPASKLFGRNPTFDIIKNDGIADRYVQAVALMNNVGFKCTGITISRDGSYQYVDFFRLTASIQGLAMTLKTFIEFLTKENDRIEREYQIKLSHSALNETVRIFNEATEERKRSQDFAEDEFFKNILKKADTVSNRELIGSPFHVFWSSGENLVLDEDYWVVAPGEEAVFYKVGFMINPKDLKSKGYKLKRVVPALKMLAAQYGLNVPITEVPHQR